MSERCTQLHEWFNSLHKHAFTFADDTIPLNGVYVLFEQGETAHGTHRIVRVGTHTGKDQLRSRLKQHFIKENKDRSIFRKNIGRALLNKANDPFLTHWELDLTTAKAKSCKQVRHGVPNIQCATPFGSASSKVLLVPVPG